MKKKLLVVVAALVEVVVLLRMNMLVDMYFTIMLMCMLVLIRIVTTHRLFLQ